MALVSFTPPVRKDIPHEPGEWMEFRKPAHRRVREARAVVESEGRRGVRDFGAEIVKALNEGDDDEKAMRRIKRLEREQEYHVDQFDRETLLRSTIVRWSYKDPATGEPITVTDETIAELDEPTARWAHQHVVDLMKPPTPEAEKNS
jgi:hypothetical protein